MSYCRWSSMNWRCDVYVYEDVSGGWTTHIAGNRRLLPPIPDIPINRWPSFGGKWSCRDRKVIYPSAWHAVAAHAMFGFCSFWHNWVHMLSLRMIPLVKIGLQCDGMTFNDSTPGDCADQLEYLRRLGYIVPQYAIDALRDEQKEAA